MPARHFGGRRERDGAGLVGTSDHNPARLRAERLEVDAFIARRRAHGQKPLEHLHALDFDPRFTDGERLAYNLGSLFPARRP